MNLIFTRPDSIADSDASAASSGGKWELTSWTECISSYLPPLDAADASESAIESALDYTLRTLLQDLVV